MPNNEIFEPTTFTLSSLFDHAYEVPAYQRPYSWKGAEHVQVLLNDIQGAYIKYKENSNEHYYTGTFYYNYKCSLPGGKSKYFIIDGQQRITTYALIFLCLHALSNVNSIIDHNSQYSLIQNAFLWKNNGRGRDRTLKFLELNSLDKKILNDIFEKAYDSPAQLKSYVENYNCSTGAERHIQENFLLIYKFYEKNIFADNCISENDPQNYLNFILNQIFMVGIRTNFNTKKIFEMFESINSKFKRLDDIDLIKTYIFKNISEGSYDGMLGRWSELIKGTDDNLEDYLKVYIRSSLKQVSNLNIKQFSTSLIELIKEKFGLSSELEAVNKLIDELEKWLPAYQKLINLEHAKEVISSNEFEAYFRIFDILSYEHPKPLLFKCFCFLQEGKITPRDVTNIWKSSTLYMLSFKSIMNQDSKSSIKVFSDICSTIRDTDIINSIDIAKRLNESMSSKSITADALSAALSKMEFYEKPIAFPVLSLIHAIDAKSDDDIKHNNYSVSDVDYDKAVLYLRAYRTDTLQIDHIMNQTPEDTSLLKYRCIKSGYFAHEYLKLIPPHDFPSSINNIEIKDGMSYPSFKALTINRLGNLRIITGHINIIRRNHATYLGEGENVTSYTEMQNRGKRLANYFVNCPSLQII